MSIIRISSNDWKKFKTIRLAGLKSDPQAFAGGFSEEINREENEWRKRLEDPDRLFFAVEENGVFVSITGAMKTSDKVWMLVGVHTLPEMRGNGFARGLVERVIEEVTTKGADALQLMVNIDQKDAVRMYEKVGFKVVRTMNGEMMGDGKMHDEYFMERKTGDL